MERRSKSGSWKKRRYEGTLPLTIGEITEDGILCSILSSLTIRDAVRTSILSSRWRHLWRYLPNLNFDVNNMFENDEYKDKGDEIFYYEAEEQKRILEGRAHQLIGRVNKFLESHHGAGVKTFAVHHFLHNEHADHLDKWVDFAITSGAQDLSLKLSDDISKVCDYYPDSYDFPCRLFTGGRGSSIERLNLHYCTLSVAPNFDGFRLLKAIQLKDVDVCDSDFEGLLSNSSVLESLDVYLCVKLVNLMISNPSGRLKFVLIGSCHSLVGLEVNAQNLTTFEYFGHKACILFRKAPKLTRAFIGFDGADTVEYFFNELKDDLPLLENLFLRVYMPRKLFPVDDLLVIHNTFTHLKRLELIIPQRGFYWLPAVLSAAPFLKKFELNLYQSQLKLKDVAGLRIMTLQKNPCHHHHLKTIEINGFTGNSSQIEFARYMLNNAVVLELMTLSSRGRSCRRYMGNFTWQTLHENRLPLGRKVREKILVSLNGQGPPGAKLIIL